VRLYDHFVENGRAYLVLEYIEGKTLRQVLQESGPMSHALVRELGLQMCDILAYLHSRDPQVIHCDLAPDNLILTPSGKVKLVDFDVARVVDARAYSVIAGRPSYTPPEQFRGNPTIQSDIFALGAILHFLSTGKDPAPLAIGLGQCDAEEELSGVASLIKDCLAFEASARPASASVVAERLECLIEDDSGTATGAFTIKTSEREREPLPIIAGERTATSKIEVES
jgi:serine/threonine protein kinase